MPLPCTVSCLLADEVLFERLWRWQLGTVKQRYSNGISSSGSFGKLGARSLRRWNDSGCCIRPGSGIVPAHLRTCIA
jgi:hypothetical protein